LFRKIRPAKIAKTATFDRAGVSAGCAVSYTQASLGDRIRIHRLGQLRLPNAVADQSGKDFRRGIPNRSDLQPRPPLLKF
jgi:hypothetical protein